MSFFRLIQRLLMISALIGLTGCATIKLGTVPPPEDTTQLRVALYAVTGLVKVGDWGSSAEDFRKWNHQRMGRMLKNYGAYQVVSEQEVRAVLGDQDPTEWQLSRNDWELARDMGRALHADYVLVSVRGTLGDPDYYFETTLLNVATGAKYAVRINNTRERKPNAYRLPPGTYKLAYRELFNDAKRDLLATALRKSLKQKGDLERSRIAAEKSFTTAPRQVKYQDAEKKEEQVKGRKKLIVYDISSAESLQVAALILSEALREEILSRGTFNLVNRENMTQLVEELKFQQSGVVDPSQAVRLGKGAGANEVVMGNIGSIGKTLLLQSKRVDVETMLNLSAASLKGRPGQEDELLKELPALVDRLFTAK
jgi:hypothetical protein